MARSILYNGLWKSSASNFTTGLAIPQVNILTMKYMQNSQQLLQNRQAKRGFTLIEILIVAVLISIIGFFTLITISGFIEKRALQSATEQIITGLEHVQNLSLTAEENKTHGINFSAPRQYSFVRQDSVSGTVTKQNFVLPSQISFDLGTGFPNPIMYSKREAKPNLSNPNTIILKSKKFKVTITIDPSGMIEATNVENI